VPKEIGTIQVLIHYSFFYKSLLEWVKTNDLNCATFV
jgi:hypothetical protein